MLVGKNLTLPGFHTGVMIITDTILLIKHINLCGTRSVDDHSAVALHPKLWYLLSNFLYFSTLKVIKTGTHMLSIKY